jgi:hypothetical protein
MHNWFLRDRIAHCIHELLGRETPQDGDDAIMAANGMKSQGKREEPESGGCDPASSEIADDDSDPRDTIHLPQERHRVTSSKVVQDLRAHDNIDAPVGERQAQRVPANGEADSLSAGARDFED